MKVVICGSRRFNDADADAAVAEAVERSRYEVTTVVSGVAPGIDRAGERWAESRGIQADRYPADWDRYGRAAGPIRNKQMVDVADAVIAVMWMGIESRGTASTIGFTRQAGKPLAIAHAYKTDLDDGEVALVVEREGPMRVVTPSGEVLHRGTWPITEKEDWPGYDESGGSCDQSG